MKNIKFLTLIFIGLIAFNACDNNDSLTYIAEPSGDFAFSNTFLSEYTLTPATAGNIGERFTWNDADFGVQTNVTYELQKSILGDFSDMSAIGTTETNEYTLTIGDLLDYAEEAGLDNDPDTDNPDTGDVYFRLRAYVGADSTVEILTSTQALTLYLPEDGGEEVIPLIDLFLVGDATAPVWNNNLNNPPIIRHPDNINMYSYKAYFEGGGEGFKLLEVLGQWQPQWGIGANAGEVAVNDGTGSDPSAFPITTSGYYNFTIDTENMTYTLEEYDASADVEYTTIGIIGTATTGDDTGWDDDINMTQSTFDPHIWVINGVSLFDGELKMRADNAWDANWGNNTAISGFGTQDGPNIPVTEGTYDIWFNDLDGGYILISAE